MARAIKPYATKTRPGGMKAPTSRMHIMLLMGSLSILAWSGASPADRFTWWLETIPAFSALAILCATYRRLRLTDISYFAIAIHAAILAIGGHYTYAEVPLFNHLRDALDLTRNHYDRIGHFAQGFVPALVGRELLLRTSTLKPGKWLTALILLSAAGISAIYEILEWLAAATTEDGAAAFLGTQGDDWDTQKDMLLALIGAAAALVSSSGIQDRQIKNPSGRPDSAGLL